MRSISYCWGVDDGPGVDVGTAAGPVEHGGGVRCDSQMASGERGRYFRA